MHLTLKHCGSNGELKDADKPRNRIKQSRVKPSGLFFSLTRRVKPKVAGGRSEAKTTGKEGISLPHPGGVPLCFWHLSKVLNLSLASRWSPLCFDHRLLVDRPSG